MFLTGFLVQPLTVGSREIAFTLPAAAIITRDNYSENNIHRGNMYKVEQEGSSTRDVGAELR